MRDLPQTHAVQFLQRVAGAAALAVEFPIEVTIYVPTPGAPIGCTTDDGPNPRWRLYTGPIRVDTPMTLRVRTIGYGYKESAEMRTALTRLP